ncbi:MAG TPA: MMPL family transporter [Thermoleophilaceae bacterium]|jgi:RND superfamily putative drug exporter
MARLLTFSGSRRAKIYVALFWMFVIFGLGAAAVPEKFADAEQNRSVDYLPQNAESVEVIDKVGDFRSGERFAAVVVYRRDGGLTAADRDAIAQDRGALAGLDVAGRPPPPPPPAFAPDGSTALNVKPLVTTGDGDILRDEVDAIREVAGGAPQGLQVEVTGPAGFAADAVDVFASIGGVLLIGTALLVFVLLILIYRSPIFWIIPFFAVVVAEVSSRGLGYLLSELGVTVTGQSSSILTVLVFGAGTDYALLIVARYREELRRQEDKHAAVATAMRAAGPAIIASAATVMVALLCLSLAEVTGTNGLALIGAMGVGLAMLVMCTLLPALLAIFPRGAFWPRVPRFGDEGADATHGAWRRIAERVGGRPRLVGGAGLLALVVMSLGLAWYSTDLSTGNQFRDDESSTRGQELVARAFPAGANVPNTVIVPNPGETPQVQDALRARPEVASVGEPEIAEPGARFDLVLRAEPYSRRAYDQIPDLRRVAREAGGDGVLIGGPTAEERDLRASTQRDTKVIMPLVLVVVFLVLAAILRAIVLPAILLASVVASYVAALGVGYFFFEFVFDFPGADPSLPLWTFVFLVALGVDYNIFLMARVREEATRHGTRQGMLRGLAVTGGVITSAGIVLAGTFSVLGSLPLVFLTELGFVIAFGVLLDTFVVRSVIVPALVFDIGPRVWWPSTLRLSMERRLPRARRLAPEPEPAPAPEAGGG